MNRGVKMQRNIRVWNLYRVSTKLQLTNTEEIPMQRHYCTKFIENKQGWELHREITELGVSAFKNRAEERVVLNSILQGAINKEFDVLLVYKADRLGRLGIDSVRFLMKLLEYGVKTFSTIENYLSVETAQDRDITGLYFHISENESLNTSKRVSDFMEMYNEEGKYMGGTPPYGYKLIDTGIQHWKKRDKTVNELRIRSDEADIVKEIFYLAFYEGMGAQRIAKNLNGKGYKTRVNGIWRVNVISRILRNTIYIGFKRFGTTDNNGLLKEREHFQLQPKNSNLEIIDEDIFWGVQKLLDQRLNRENRSTHGSYATASRMILTGIAKCGYCFTTLKADYSLKSYNRKTDGKTTKMTTYRYTCNTSRSDQNNHGMSRFSSKKFEAMVEENVLNYIRNIDFEIFDREVDKFLKENIEQNEIEVKQIRKNLDNMYRELEALKEEVINTIMGRGKFSNDLLQELIAKKEKEILELNKTLNLSELVLLEKRTEANDLHLLKLEVSDWESRYNNSDINDKKKMMNRIIKDLQFKKDEIFLKLTLPIEKALPSL